MIRARKQPVWAALILTGKMFTSKPNGRGAGTMQTWFSLPIDAIIRLLRVFNASV
jgi:hypothetical protein